MALPIPDAPLPPQSYGDLRADDNYNEVNFPQDAKPPSYEEPFNEEEAPQMGKYISVDPLSWKESSSLVVDKELKASSRYLTLVPGASKPKFISHSLPNSVTSTPKVGTTMKKQWSHASPTRLDALARQDSEAFLFRGSWRDDHLQTNSTGGEERASTAFDDLDIISPKVSSREFNIRPSFHSSAACSYSLCPPSGYSYSLCPPKFDVKKDIQRKGKKSYYNKCCWYLPNFGRGKPVGAKNYGDTGHVISRTVSLEKFECGSWAESGIVNESEKSFADSSSYFDLPLELIRSGVSDALSPVRTAFYFDKDASRGSRKNISTRKSHASSSSSQNAGSRSSWTRKQTFLQHTILQLRIRKGKFLNITSPWVSNSINWT